MMADLSNHSATINPLANPKGVKLECELCGKPAYLQCKLCRVTYYCEKEHEALDFRGIHDKICSRLPPLRIPVASLGSESERAQREDQVRKQQVELFEITRTESEKLLFEGQFDLAIPAALQALRFSMILSGQDNIELVPSYLLLARASIGLKRYNQAEDYLSLAKWAILKVPDCSPKVRGSLHRHLGVLYLSQGHYPEALKQLALDVYYFSMAHSPEHISATEGYYQLGNVFHKQNKIDLVTAHFDKVVTIWKTTLAAPHTRLDAAQIAEGVYMLSTIYAFRTNYSKGLISVAEVDYVLGLIYHDSGDYEKAKEHASKALSAFEANLGREHSLTTDVRNLVKMIVESAPQLPKGLTPSSGAGSKRSR